MAEEVELWSGRPRNFCLNDRKLNKQSDKQLDTIFN